MAIGQSVNPDASLMILIFATVCSLSFWHCADILLVFLIEFHLSQNVSYKAFPYGMRQGGTRGQQHSVTIMSLSARRGPKILLPDIGSGIPDRRQAVLVVTTTTLAIATLFVASRLVSRIAIVRRTAWDDYFIVLGWVRTCAPFCINHELYAS